MDGKNAIKQKLRFFYVRILIVLRTEATVGEKERTIVLLTQEVFHTGTSGDGDQTTAAEPGSLQ